MPTVFTITSLLKTRGTFYDFFQKKTPGSRLEEITIFLQLPENILHAYYIS